MAGYIDSDGVERLCQAVIVQAAKDYRRSLAILKKNPSSESGKDGVREVERFFRSGYYEMMTDVDGEYLIRKLREEVNGR